MILLMIINSKELSFSWIEYKTCQNNVDIIQTLMKKATESSITLRYFKQTPSINQSIKKHDQDLLNIKNVPFICFVLFPCVILSKKQTDKRM